MPSRGSHEGIERLIPADRWAGTDGEVSHSGDGLRSDRAGGPGGDGVRPGGDGVRLGGDGAARGYAPRRTLPLRVEIGRQWARRRTRLALGFVVLATTGAANFTLFTVFAATGFLLVVIFALFAGDTVASEASWSSLRYLLAAPVPRSRLLRQKLLVALGFSLVALVLLPAVAYVVGGLFYGWAPAR